MSSHTRRIIFVDVARALAIALALFSHAMTDASAWGLDSTAAFPLRIWTRSAAPLFIVMFGMMLELVYVRRARTTGFRGVATRLIRRSLQCYVAYAFTAVAGWIGGILTFKGAITASLMITDAYFGNVLKWYTFGLLFAVPLLRVRLRWGIWSVVALAGAAWGVASLPWTAWVTLPEHLLNVAGVLIGYDGRYGPSVFHGLTFVAVGMLLSHALRKETGRATFYGRCGVLILLVIIAFTVGSWKVPFLDVLHHSIESTWRQNNSLMYFSLGVGLSVTTLVILALALHKNNPLPRWSRFPLRFGQSSLLAFTVGNVFLNVRPRVIVTETFVEACVFGGAFLVVTLLTLHLVPLLRSAARRVRPVSRARAIVRRTRVH